jgi:dienelactone hydrolase
MRRTRSGANERESADYEFVTYSGADHGFTNPTAASYKIPGFAYQAKADARSWALMQELLKEVFAR